MMTRQQAALEGRILMRKMTTRGWKLRVWENQGWHYAITNGSITVHPTFGGYYFTLMSPDAKRPGGGLAVWTFQRRSKDPNKVVRWQVEDARRIIQGYLDALHAAEVAAGMREKEKKKYGRR